MRTANDCRNMESATVPALRPVKNVNKYREGSFPRGGVNRKRCNAKVDGVKGDSDIIVFRRDNSAAIRSFILRPRDGLVQIPRSGCFLGPIESFTAVGKLLDHRARVSGCGHWAQF